MDEEIETSELLSSSSDSEEEKPSSIKGKGVYRLFGRERPIHMLLGGGNTADVLLWRDKKVSVGLVGGATVVWLLFEVLEYHFISLLCHVLILASAFLYLWSNAAPIIINRSLPEIPQLRIPQGPVVRITRGLNFEINRAFFVLRAVAAGRDLKKFLIAIGVLWIVSGVGRYCDFLTVIYTVMVVAFTVPRFYEKYEDQVDAFAEKADVELQKQYKVFDAKVLSKITIFKQNKMA